MKLSHAVFVYPRIETPYIRHWLDYHEKQGVDHVYMTLHINEPIDQVLEKRHILWTKKPDIPYITDGTEQDLINKLKIEISDHIERERITFNFATRKMDFSGTSHRKDQKASYEWAKQKVLEKNDPEFDWILVGDVDEYFLSEDSNKNIKNIISEESRVNVSCLRCWSIMHPSRHNYPIGDLPWNTYAINAGIGLCTSKYAARARSTHLFDTHYSWPIEGSVTEFFPKFNVHHFRGFDHKLSYKGWPIENRIFFNKTQEENYQIIKLLNSNPIKGPHP